MRTAYASKAQTSSSSQANTSLGGSLRCSDFNYNRVTKNYSGENDKVQGMSIIHRRHISGVQDRRSTNYYGLNNEHQQNDFSLKREKFSLLSSRNQLNEDINNNLADSISPQASGIKPEMYRYQTPQKIQSSYHNRSQTTSFSEQWGKKNDLKQEQSPLGETKEQLKQKYLRYTTDHSRFTASMMDDGRTGSSVNHKEDSQTFSSRLSKQDQRSLIDSPTKENEMIEIGDQQQKKSVSSYSGFISRSPNNYYKRQQTFESPMKEESSILCESFSKALNYKTTSAYTRDPSPQSISNRDTQSDKKNFTGEIEQYKKDLKDYQSQLSSYQEQLRKTLNRNRAELFDPIGSQRDDHLKSSISNYSKASFLDLKQQNSISKSVADADQAKITEVINGQFSIGSKFIQSDKVSKHLQKAELEGGINLFASINMNSTSFDASPEKVLDVINLDLSPPVVLTKCESEYYVVQPSNEKNSIIKLRKIMNNEEEEEDQILAAANISEHRQKTKVSSFENDDNLVIKYNNNMEEKVELKQVVAQSREENLQESKRQIQNNSELMSKYRCSSSQANRSNFGTPALDQDINMLESQHRIDIINNKNQQLHSNQMVKIDSVIKDIKSEPQNRESTVTQKIQTNQDEQSSKTINSSLKSSSQTDYQQKIRPTPTASENIITNQQDKLKEIENRYKRVEEISKKYSHLYKSKLLSSTPTPTTIKSELQVQRTESQLQPSHISPVSLSSNSMIVDISQISIAHSLSESAKSIIQSEQSQINNIPFYGRKSLTEQSRKSSEIEVISPSPLQFDSSVYCLNDTSDNNLNIFISETPRFMINEGIKYFSSAKQILSLNNHESRKEQVFYCSDRIEETFQNISQIEIEQEEQIPTFRLQHQQSPSVTSL